MEITVETNRRVSVRRINQFYAYAGLLEGLPYDKLNDRIIKSALEAARKFGFDEIEVFLIEPVREPIAYEGTYRLGKPERLPSVVCMAVLQDYMPARDATADYSDLVVVWFQEEFAFPLQANILVAFAELPWSKVASDCEY